MTATVLRFDYAVREAALDARAIERKLRAEGSAWAPALQRAREIALDLAHSAPAGGRYGSRANPPVLQKGSEP